MYVTRMEQERIMAMMQREILQSVLLRQEKVIVITMTALIV